MILPSDLTLSTRRKLFDFVDAFCSEFPEVNSKVRAGVLKITNGTFQFAVRLTAIEKLERWFWAMVVRNEQTSCWEWQGARDINGYGIIKFGGRRILAHRASLILITGYDSNNLGLHRCDNPPCVNPFHLYRGDHQDNSNDLDSRGRRVILLGRDNPNTRLIQFQGRTLSFMEWRGKLGLSQAALHKRLRKWTLQEALTKPKRIWKTKTK